MNNSILPPDSGIPRYPSRGCLRPNFLCKEFAFASYRFSFCFQGTIEFTGNEAFIIDDELGKPDSRKPLTEIPDLLKVFNTLPGHLDSADPSVVPGTTHREAE